MRMLIAIATMVALSGSAAFACSGKTAWMLKHQDQAASARTAPPADETSS
ncbi:MAG: hypothetical protein U1E59_16160 [Amaricoccus sp.]